MPIIQGLPSLVSRNFENEVFWKIFLSNLCQQPGRFFKNYVMRNFTVVLFLLSDFKMWGIPPCGIMTG
jgi:hypothetical protein